MERKAVVEQIVNWLKNYVSESTTKGFVIGVSGGIDSAVTSTLAAKTGLPTIVVDMPIHQHQDQVNRGESHISWLKRNFPNVRGQKAELSSTFEQLKKALPEPVVSNVLAMANTRARIRMTTLYAIAGSKSYLVVGTGNKIEDFGIGFFTKYGDGGVDLSPIADLTKTQVFELGEELGINDEILSAAPTDGLWGDERTDEQQIGATYPELEWAMHYEENTIQNIALTERQKEVLGIYKSLHSANKHKMIPIPVCRIPTTEKI